MIRTVSARARQVEITPETALIDDLAMDSLDLVSVLMLIEDRYQVGFDFREARKIRQVRDLVLVSARPSRSAA